jgi:hypothetical protein
MKADPGGSVFFVCRVGRRHHLINAKEVITHGKITAGSEERSQKTEEQEEVALQEIKI